MPSASESPKEAHTAYLHSDLEFPAEDKVRECWPIRTLWAKFRSVSMIGRAGCTARKILSCKAEALKADAGYAVMAPLSMAYSLSQNRDQNEAICSAALCSHNHACKQG